MSPLNSPINDQSAATSAVSIVSRSNYLLKDGSFVVSLSGSVFHIRRAYNLPLSHMMLLLHHIHSDFFFNDVCAMCALPTTINQSRTHFELVSLKMNLLCL